MAGALITLLLGYFALDPMALAVTPAPDGGYPGGNTAEGFQALQSLTTGTYNTALGQQALFRSTTGSYNSAEGFRALFNNTTGFFNTATGVNALYSSTTGRNNEATGYAALFHNTIGNSNAANGTGALFTNTSGGNNTATGTNALYSNTTASYNVATGSNTLFRNTTGTGNVANGTVALYNNTTGNNNTANGYQALSNNTSGNLNVAIGDGALLNNTTGSSNIALGEDAGFNLTVGNNNISIGNKGVAGESGIIRIGTEGTHTKTVLVGNVGIGTSFPQSKLEVNASDLFVGKSPTGKFLGAAGFDFNSASVVQEGLLIEQAFANAGESSGIYFDGDSITMWSAGDGNRLLIVRDEDGMSEKFAIDGSGNAIANGVMLTSSRRFKENVAPIANALDKVSRLQGVTFDWKKDRGGKSDMGFVAEDLGKVLPELVLWEKNGTDAVGVEYANVTAVTVEAIKELKVQKDQEIAALKAANAALAREVEALEARDQAREERLTRLEDSR